MVQGQRECPLPDMLAAARPQAHARTTTSHPSNETQGGGSGGAKFFPPEMLASWELNFTGMGTSDLVRCAFGVKIDNWGRARCMCTRASVRHVQVHAFVVP